jgi:hypothetical protein
VSWGRSESRSGYFGESWGDYLIDLSIAFRGVWSVSCDNFSPLTMAIVCLLVLGLYVAGHLLPRRFGRKGFVAPWLDLNRDLLPRWFCAFGGIDLSTSSEPSSSLGIEFDSLGCHLLG